MMFKIFAGNQSSDPILRTTSSSTSAVMLLSRTNMSTTLVRDLSAQSCLRGHSISLPIVSKMADRVSLLVALALAKLRLLKTLRRWLAGDALFAMCQINVVWTCLKFFGLDKLPQNAWWCLMSLIAFHLQLCLTQPLNLKNIWTWVD